MPHLREQSKLTRSTSYQPHSIPDPIAAQVSRGSRGNGGVGIRLSSGRRGGGSGRLFQLDDEAKLVVAERALDLANDAIGSTDRDPLTDLERRVSRQMPGRNDL